MEFVILWLILGGIVGAIADSRGRNPIAYFFLSLVLSPVLGLILVLVASNKKEEARQAEERRHDHERQVASLQALGAGRSGPDGHASPGSQPPTISIADELTKLALLKEKGILNDEEFQRQKATLLAMR